MTERREQHLQNTYAAAPMDARRHRVVLLTLAATLVAVVVATVLWYPAGGEESLPPPLLAVDPLPQSTVAAQTEVIVTIGVGYTVSLVVDGRPIPPEELVAVPATGTYRWRPQPGGVIERWEPGDHTVEVAWNRPDGQVPDPGSYAWSFRVI